MPSIKLLIVYRQWPKFVRLLATTIQTGVGSFYLAFTSSDTHATNIYDYYSSKYIEFYILQIQNLVSRNPLALKCVGLGCEPECHNEAFFLLLREVLSLLFFVKSFYFATKLSK